VVLEAIWKAILVQSLKSYLSRLKFAFSTSSLDLLISALSAEIFAEVKVLSFEHIVFTICFIIFVHVPVTDEMQDFREEND